MSVCLERWRGQGRCSVSVNGLSTCVCSCLFQLINSVFEQNEFFLIKLSRVFHNTKV